MFTFLNRNKRLFSTLGAPSTLKASKGIRPNYKHPVPERAQWSKLTNEPILQDSFGRFHNYLRISLTERCNFNCVYCVYDQDIQYTPKPELLTYDELVRLTKLFVYAGVDKIRLTGGDPLMYKKLPEFIKEIGGMPEVKKLGMTTNGFKLYQRLEEFKENGLNVLNMSLDSFVPEKAERLSRTKGYQHVIQSVHKALYLNYSPLKLNCVVMRGVNDDELLDFVEFVRDKNVNVRFIEFFSIGNNGWDRSKMVPYAEMKQRIEERFGPMTPSELKFGDTARNFTIPNFVGTVSFITSVSQPFCAKCNRVRLLSNGLFRRCLHDERMLDVKDAMRKGASDQAILELISAFIKKKEAAHAGMDIISKLQTDGMRMIQIGG